MGAISAAVQVATVIVGIGLMAAVVLGVGGALWLWW